MPSHVEDGQTMRLKGKGNPSQMGGPSGDAMVTLKFVSDGMFRIEGRDVHVDVDVPLDHAIQGGKLTVQTLQKKIALNLEPLFGREMTHGVFAARACLKKAVVLEILLCICVCNSQKVLTRHWKHGRIVRIYRNQNLYAGITLLFKRHERMLMAQFPYVIGNIIIMRGLL